MSVPIRFALAPLALLTAAPLAPAGDPPAGTVLYVDDDAPPGGDGQSWETAFRYLQDALDAAHEQPTVEELRVAGGAYRPDQGASVSVGDDRAILQPPSGLSIRGGFAGIEGGMPDAQNPMAWPTVVSGDLAEDDNSPTGSRFENSDGLFAPQGTKTDIVVQGVEFASADRALFLDSDSEIEFRECIFTLNGGDASVLAPIIIQEESTVLFVDCLFTRNTMNLFESDNGAAVLLVSDGSNVLVSDSEFSRNTATNFSGAVHATNSGGDRPSIAIERCLFENNAVIGIDPENVGGLDASSIRATGAVVSINSTLFRGNNAELPQSDTIAIEGGFHPMGSVAEIRNSIMTGNAASGSSGVRFPAGLTTNPVDATITNCILARNTGSAAMLDWSARGSLQISNSVFWQNFPSGVEIGLAAGSISIDWTRISSGTAMLGEGNLSSDPLLRDLLGPDGFAGTGDEDLRLAPGSPCIDAGSNTAAADAGITCDFDGEPRRYDDPMTPDTGEGASPIVDMGALEFRESPPPPCPTDLDGDCVTGANDLATVIAAWGTPGADLSGDGLTGATDLAMVIGAWGLCP